ncbi:MAG TPA: inositol monophosphatase family protein [Solirubrobacterales bacterium]|nr:inositol monophosphatase family protein [Solirubrobacterales bacterium]
MGEAAGPDLLEADWLGAMRRVVAAQRRLLESESGIADRTVFEGVGEGGDHSLAIDRRSEDIVFAELEALHDAGYEFTAVSEERGEVAFGDADGRVVIDPIDGSLNARRTLPTFALSVAVASGPSMADVELGYVYDFGAGEEFCARRGQGAWRNGAELEARGPGYGLELVGIESAKPELLLPLLGRMTDRVARIRSLGSVAVSLCYVAAGRFDGMVSSRTCRSVDAAAGQLIVREAGGNVRFGELEAKAADLGLAARYELAAALDEEMLHTLLETLPGFSAET